MRRVVTSVLQKEGHTVLVVNDGREAIRINSVTVVFDA